MSTCSKTYKSNLLTRRMPEIDDKTDDNDSKCGEVEPER